VIDGGGHSRLMGDCLCPGARGVAVWWMAMAAAAWLGGGALHAQVGAVCQGSNITYGAGANDGENPALCAGSSFVCQQPEVTSGPTYTPDHDLRHERHHRHAFPRQPREHAVLQRRLQLRGGRPARRRRVAVHVVALGGSAGGLVPLAVFKTVVSGRLRFEEWVRFPCASCPSEG